MDLRGDERTRPLPLQPMTVADLLDGAFTLYAGNVRAIVILTALFVVPVNLVSAFMQRTTLGGGSFLDTVTNPTFGQAGLPLPGEADLAAAAGTVLFSLATTPFVTGLICRVVAAGYLGERLDWGAALRGTAGRFWALLGAFVLVHLVQLGPLAVNVGLLVAAASAGPAAAVPLGLLLPVTLLFALAAMGMFVMVTPAVVVEGLGPVAAMRRAWRLTWPRYWPVLGIGILSGLVAYLVGSVLGSPFELAALAVGFGAGWPLLALSGIVPQLVATPLVAIVATLVYYDARIRLEGLDLELALAGGEQEGQRPDPGGWNPR